MGLAWPCQFYAMPNVREKDRESEREKLRELWVWVSFNLSIWMLFLLWKLSAVFFCLQESQSKFCTVVWCCTVNTQMFELLTLNYGFCKPTSNQPASQPAIKQNGYSQIKISKILNPSGEKVCKQNWEKMLVIHSHIQFIHTYMQWARFINRYILVKMMRL